MCGGRARPQEPVHLNVDICRSCNDEEPARTQFRRKSFLNRGSNLRQVKNGIGGTRHPPLAASEA